MSTQNTKTQIKKIIDIVGEPAVAAYLNEVAEWLVEDQTYTFSAMRGSETPKHEWLLAKTNEYLKNGSKGEFNFLNELDDAEERNNIANLLKIVGIKRVNSALKALKKANNKININSECKRLCGDSTLRQMQNLLTDLQNHKAKPKTQPFAVKKSTGKKLERLVNDLLGKTSLESVINGVARITKEKIGRDINDIIFAQPESGEFIDLISFDKVQKRFVELSERRAREN